MLVSPKALTGGKPCQEIWYEFVPVRGTGGSLVVEDSLWMRGSNTTTVTECAKWISQQKGFGVNDDCHQVKFSMGDFGVKTVTLTTNDTGESGETVSHFLCHQRPIVVKHRSWALDGPQVYVKFVTGKQIRLNLPRHPTAADMKFHIHLKEGIPTDQQRLLFEGNQLEDETTLSTSGIRNDSLVHLVLRIRGGGRADDFVDVTNSEALWTAEWNREAPDWGIAHKGLTLEGVCHNKKCRAHGEMVVMNAGFTNFDFLSRNDKERSRCKCPICHTSVTPIKPGFNNCLWKVSAVKKSDPMSVFDRSWTRAENNYTTYDEAVAGTTEFSRLQIFVRPLSRGERDVELDCAICLEGLAVDSSDKVKHKRLGRFLHPKCARRVTNAQKVKHESNCGHFFHPECARTWANAQKRRNVTPSCPLCRATN